MFLGQQSTPIFASALGECLDKKQTSSTLRQPIRIVLKVKIPFYQKTYNPFKSIHRFTCHVLLDKDVPHYRLNFHKKINLTF